MRAKRGPGASPAFRGLGSPQRLPFFSFAAGGGRRKGVQRASLCLTRMPMGILYGYPDSSFLLQKLILLRISVYAPKILVNRS